MDLVGQQNQRWLFACLWFDVCCGSCLLQSGFTEYLADGTLYARQPAGWWSALCAAWRIALYAPYFQSCQGFGCIAGKCETGGQTCCVVITTRKRIWRKSISRYQYLADH